MNAKEILRWAVVLGLGPVGLFVIGSFAPQIFQGFVAGDWGLAIFALFLCAIIAGPPLALSYFAFRRQYRHLIAVISAVAAVFTFGFVVSMMGQFYEETSEFLLRQITKYRRYLWAFSPSRCCHW